MTVLFALVSLLFMQLAVAAYVCPDSGSKVAGIAAMSTASVLDHEKVVAVLSRLTPQERFKAIEGLALLADAAMQLRCRRPDLP